MTNEEFEKALRDIDVFKTNPEWSKAYALKLLAYTNYQIARELRAARSVLFKMNELLEEQFKVTEGEDDGNTEEKEDI